jgi:hypothetical protein
MPSKKRKRKVKVQVNLKVEVEVEVEVEIEEQKKSPIYHRVYNAGDATFPIGMSKRQFMLLRQEL